MSTVGCYSNLQNCPTKGIAPMPKDTRTVVKEEMKRQKELDKLEAKYQNGEISKLEYGIQKAIVNNMPIITDPRSGMHFSTTA